MENQAQFHIQLTDHQPPPPPSYEEDLDDDGRPKRTGTVWTATSHIITAIIGSGVLSLAWAVAQLGWVAGVTSLLCFSCVTLYTSNLLADCYRSPDPLTGKRNYTYKEAVKNNLGGKMHVLCGIAQYCNLCGMVIGYTITSSISMVAIQKSNCFHKTMSHENCSFSHNPYMIGLGVVQIFLSQIPSFDKLSILSIVAAIMSFTYASIGIGLALAKIVSGEKEKSSLTGVEIGLGISAADKTWKMFRALGDIAFAFTFSQVLVEIQDTLKSTLPENKVMRKANMLGVLTTTTFYVMSGCIGYAALGNPAKGNMLTGFGFYEPFWLIDLANICIVVHLVGAYQVFAQPLFNAVETEISRRWPKSKFVKKEYPIGMGKIKISFNLLRLTWRTSFVVLATFTAMLFPFFNEVLSLLGAFGYWPLTVYFPISMFIANKRIQRWSSKWVGLQLVNTVCFLVALAAACGSIQGIGLALKTYKPFTIKE
ncbi:amino acid permease 8-like [Impatiens glandulifera]|uniref:amino acid permease 8-like n=1 Tax=Impatiens glandulifera TaxID=253017 RepID=UPI001FB10FCD|nr:amino acid permease 8-like [Impatiens glandulifera]